MQSLNRFTRMLLLFVACCLHFLATRTASATIAIATVPVDNPGNAPDTTGYGEVDYNFNIGEYDVTSSQYTAFLNSVAGTDTYGLYNSGMANTNGPGIIQGGAPGDYSYSVINNRDNYPVIDVTFWDAARFANWLNNGQPTGLEGPGTTETGTYTLTSTGMAYNTVTRNATGAWAVTSENEWYKAAYYSPTLNGRTSGYWQYPTQSNTIDATQANFDLAAVGITPVGYYPDPSYYGTYDQGGDVFQWNDTIINNGYRGLRGGSYSNDGSFLSSNSSAISYPNDPWNVPPDGFRVSQVPEPGNIGIIGFITLGMLVRNRIRT